MTSQILTGVRPHKSPWTLNSEPGPATRHSYIIPHRRLVPNSFAYLSSTPVIFLPPWIKTTASNVTDRSQTDYRDVSVTVNGGSPLNIVSVRSLNIHNEEVMSLVLFLLAVLIAKGWKPSTALQGNKNLLWDRALVDQWWICMCLSNPL